MAPGGLRGRFSYYGDPPSFIPGRTSDSPDGHPFASVCAAIRAPFDGFARVRKAAGGAGPGGTARFMAIPVCVPLRL